MPSHTFYRDYDACRRDAGAESTRLGLLVRLRAVTEYGRKGYVYNSVPREDWQYGRDLDGELIRPTDPAW